MSEELPKDAVGHLAQFCDIPTLGMIASSCRTFSGRFMWNQYKVLDLTNVRNAEALIKTLVKHEVRIEYYHEVLDLFKKQSEHLADQIAINSAQTLKHVVLASDYVVPHLLSSVLETAQLNFSDTTEVLLKTGCPNLRQLGLFHVFLEKDVHKIVPLLSSLPKLEHLKISIDEAAPVVEVCHALSGRLKTLNINATSFTRMIMELGLEITDLDAAAADRIVRDNFCIPLWAFKIKKNTFVQLFISKINWATYSSSSAASGAIQELMNRVTTHVSFLNGQSLFNHSLGALRHLTFRAGENLRLEFMPQVLAYICELLLSTLPLIQGDPYTHLATLADIFVALFDHLNTLPDINIAEAFELRLASAMKSFVESDRRFLERLFQTNWRVPSNMISSMFGDPNWMQCVNFSANSCIGGGPVIRQCQLPAAVLVVQDDAFDPSLKLAGAPVILLWLFKHLISASNPEAMRDVTLMMSKVATWYSHHSEKIPQIMVAIQLLGWKLWEVPQFQCSAPLLRLLPRDQLLDMIPSVPKVEELPELVKFIKFVYQKVLSEHRQVWKNALLRISEQLWALLITNGVTDALKSKIDTMLDFLPLPDQVYDIYQRIEISNTGTEISLAFRSIIIERLNMRNNRDSYI